MIACKPEPNWKSIRCIVRQKVKSRSGSARRLQWKESLTLESYFACMHMRAQQVYALQQRAMCETRIIVDVV
jgi:hypothetical protein